MTPLILADLVMLALAIMVDVATLITPAMPRDCPVRDHVTQEIVAVGVCPVGEER